MLELFLKSQKRAVAMNQRVKENAYTGEETYPPETGMEFENINLA